MAGRGYVDPRQWVEQMAREYTQVSAQHPQHGAEQQQGGGAYVAATAAAVMGIGAECLRTVPAHMSDAQALVHMAGGAVMTGHLEMLQKMGPLGAHQGQQGIIPPAPLGDGVHPSPSAAPLLAPVGQDPSAPMHQFVGEYSRYFADDEDAVELFTSLRQRIDHQELGFSGVYAEIYRILYRKDSTFLLLEFQNNRAPQAWKTAMMPDIHRSIELQEDTRAAAIAETDAARRSKVVVLRLRKQTSTMISRSKIVVLNLRKSAATSSTSIGSEISDTSTGVTTRKKKTPRNAYRANVGQVSGPAIEASSEEMDEDLATADESQSAASSPPITPIKTAKRRRTTMEDSNKYPKRKGQTSMQESSGDVEDAEHESVDDEEPPPAKKLATRRRQVTSEATIGTAQEKPKAARMKGAKASAAGGEATLGTWDAVARDEPPKRLARGRRQGTAAIPTTLPNAGPGAEDSAATSTTPSKPRRKYVVAGGDEDDIGEAGAKARGHKVRK